MFVQIARRIYSEFYLFAKEWHILCNTIREDEP